MFHQQAGHLNDALSRLRANFEQAGIGYVVIGAFALNAHGYRRATNDVDLCVTREGLERFTSRLLGTAYERAPGHPRRFVDAETGVTIDLLVSGELAGRVNRNRVIRFPDPTEAVAIDGLPTVALERLIELKLVTWRFKDWADVVELIRVNRLDERFADKLDPLVRMAYLECYDQMRDEDRYERGETGAE